MGSNQPASATSAWLIACGGVLAGCFLGAVVKRDATRALAHERRRVAAEIHDLVMQDLSLALANARALAHEHPGTPRASLVVSAGERALAGARAVVSDLAKEPSRDSEPIVRAIETCAQAAARSTPLIFDARGVPGSARPDRPTREALVHIAREAVTNATKHARSSAIEVTLQYTGKWHLRVRDAGNGLDSGFSQDSGFDQSSGFNQGNGFDETGSPNSFGLASMRDHARALGGVLHIASAAEQGTTVEVTLP